MKLRFTIFLALLFTVFSPKGIFAQNVVVTYQGRVGDNGTNFSGTGQFEFALVTSSNADQTATAAVTNLDGGFIIGIGVTSGGSGYVTAPAVTIFGGGGSNATATAVITNGVVTAINVDDAGSHYSSTPTVTIAAPPANVTYTTYWSNDGTSVADSEPSAAVSLGVTNGLFTVGLGDITVPNMTAISASLFNQPGLQLQVWFNDGANGFAALSPVQNLTTAPYAAYADYAGMVSDSALPTNAIFTGSITASGFSGSGTNITSLNASSLTTGTVPLTSLSGITSNQIAAATWQLATNLNGGIAALANGLSAGVAITNATITSSSYSGNGGGLTNLVGSQIVSIGNTNGNAAGNFFLGTAGNSTMTGSNNTGIGAHALDSNTNGLYNVAVGLNALSANTTASDNAAIGTYALQANQVANNNTAVGDYALYSGTNGNNTAVGYYSLYNITSGANNTANGMNALQSSTSGSGNTAIGYNALGASTTGSNNIAIGYQAGSVIVAGSSNIDIGNPGFASDVNVIRIGATQTATYLVGTVYSTNIALTSDRNVKENFTPVDTQAVLNKLLAIPMTEWQYKVDAHGIKHIGPMAQDFHAAFGLNGSDDRHISVVDEGGIALAAIQGLNEKLEEKDAEIQALQTRLDKLERAMDAQQK